MNEDWSGEADVYIAVIPPRDDTFFFLTPPLNFGLDFLPYAVAARASDSNEILRVDLPAGLPTGEYTFHAAAMRVTGFVDKVIGNVVQASFIFATEPEPVNLTFADTRLPDGVIGHSYHFAIEPETGMPPYQFNLISGTLPDGLTLGNESGLIQGEPTERDVAKFTVQVVDVSGNVGKFGGTIKIFGLLSFGEQGTYKGCDGLQEAFNSTQDLDDIRIEQGTYKCNGLEIPSSKKFKHGIKISGGWDSGFENKSDDAAATVFDGNEEGGILTVSANGSVAIEGLSFQNGHSSEYGGAIDGKVNITHCVFTDNSASSEGGAVFGADTITNSTFTNNSASRGGAVSGADTITNSTFTNNSASENGGAVYSSSSSDFSSSIINSTFTNNKASENGGAVYYSSFTDSSSITNSTFTNNSASKNGGAVYSDSYHSYSITNSIFSNNNASENGGAIYSSSSITNSTFTNNSASENGGAVFDGGTIINSSFTNNSASSGGAVSSSSYISSSNSTIINSTFTNNRVSINGGGFYGGGTILNSIFSQNKIDEKANEDEKANDITTNGNLQLDYTLVNDISGAVDLGKHINSPLVNEISGVVYLGKHIIMGEPRFVDADNGNFRLRADSPAVDVGSSVVIACSQYDCDSSCKNNCDDRNSEECKINCCQCVRYSYSYQFLRDNNGNPLDLDGNPRVVGGVIDLGAYEVQ
jgi:predicted outer membrane repeat protein